MSWKQYGGVNNFERISDLTVNKLVADHTISKLDIYSYEGIINYLYALDLLNAKNISVLEEEVYLDASRSEFLYGYLDPSTNYGNIGVNKKNAEATFDISGANPYILNVYSDASFNENILARIKKINNRDPTVSLYIDQSYSELIFPESYIREDSGILYSLDLVLHQTLRVQGTSTLEQEVFLDPSQNEFLYGYLDPNTNYGNIGVNKKNAEATFDISGANPYILNVYSDASFNENILARNNNDKLVSLYVDNSYAEMLFPNSYIREENGVLYSLDLFLYQTLHVQGISTLEQEVYLDPSRNEYLYGINGNVGINTNTPKYILDISGNNSNAINVYSDASYSNSVLVQNNNDKLVSLYVDNSYAEMLFPNSYIREENGTLYSLDLFLYQTLHVQGISTLEQEVYLDPSRNTYLYGINGNVGINTNTPTYILDISGNNGNAINVHSDASYSSSILVQNNNDKLVSLYVDNSYAEMLFPNSYIREENGTLYSLDLFLYQTLRAQGITTLEQEVYLDPSRNTYLYGINGNVGINTNTPTYILDISGNNGNAINVYSDASYSNSILVQNNNDKLVSLYVNNSYASIAFPNASIIEENGIIYIDNLDTSNGTIDVLNTGEINSISDISINLLCNGVENIYFGVDTSYIKIGNENTTLDIEGDQTVNKLISSYIDNKNNINTVNLKSTGTIDASYIYAPVGVIDDLTVKNYVIDSVLEVSSNYIIDLTADKTTIKQSLLVECSSNFIGNVVVQSLDASSINVDNININTQIGLKEMDIDDLTVNSSFVTNGTVNINNGANITGPLNCDTILQW